MMQRLRRYIGNAEMVLMLAVGWVLVFVVPFRRVTAWLGAVHEPQTDGGDGRQDFPRAASVMRRLARIARHVPWRTTCLVQSVAGLLLLRRRGIRASVRLGVAEENGALSAHAWLLVDGKVVYGEQTAAQYRPLADFGTRH